MIYLFWSFLTVWISIIGLVAWSMYWFEDIYRKKFEKKRSKSGEYHQDKLEAWFSFMDKAWSKKFELRVLHSPFPADEKKQTYMIGLWDGDVKKREYIVNLDDDVKMVDIFTKFPEVFEEAKHENNK